ncbi:ATP-binding protein [Streptomyces sp. 891-h]|uniref:ATP-binding protein n=1 Tax=Streptomyces sp. 891-h TaxID=2720714 RepID=UPI001FA94460|nr:ATP-binding protein [Streptomyces sp. 891-h]UNZ22299.1 ATPase [Streptomyces sp. 891-h]
MHDDDTTAAPAPAPRGLARLFTTRRRTQDTTYDSTLQLRDITGHLAVTRDGTVTAWYVAAPQRWSFLSDADRNGLLAAHAKRLAELTGRRLHLRVTHRPYPVALWAEALHNSAVNPLPGWDRYLQEEQINVGRSGLDNKVVYYGVRIGRLNGLGRGSAFFGGGQRELDALTRDVQEVDGIMAAGGMQAAPVTAADMDWLLIRSLGLGLPAPLDVPERPTDQWQPGDLAEYADTVEWSSPEAYAPYVTVTGHRDGATVTRYVAILTLGQMALPPIPESGHAPWMQRLDRLPFPYEVSAVIDVREAAEVTKEMRSQLQRIYHQVKHHHEHEVDIPQRLGRQRQQALLTEDEIQSTGATGLGTRTEGWYRIAVSADSKEKLFDRVAKVKKRYGTHVLVHHTADQYRLASEFIPGEPVANDAYKRRLPVTTLAGALPAATAVVGDRMGPNIGYTSGASRRAVMWHPWRSQEIREGSGLTPLVSTLGGGKSTLMGKIVYDSTRMGAPWVLLDPSGPLTRLCGLPELRPYSREINLMNAEPGTLNPYRVIPDPDRQHYRAADYWSDRDREDAAERAYQQARKTAAASRRTLAVDVLRGLLPDSLRNSETTSKALLMAAQRADASVNSSPFAIIDALKRLSGSLEEHATHLAELLHGVSEMPQGQLIFPSADGGDDRYLSAHHRLVVMSLKGLTLPTAGVPAHEWTLEEQYSMPLLYLAAWYAQRSIYDREMHARKGLALDECWALLQVSSGRTLLKKTGRDSRKHNTRALYATQDAGDLIAADLSNWIDSAFIGRTIGEDAQRGALRMIGIEPGNGYEDQLATLSARQRDSDRTQIPREFIFSDGEGGIERITVSLAHRPQLRDVLNTTANPRAARSVPQQAERSPWIEGQDLLTKSSLPSQNGKEALR